jgi:hypothetical protein
MTDFVHLYWKRNRGWPWPEESWGLTPMFGEDGWCHACGVPNRPQTGSVVLQRKGFKLVEGCWVPNWRFDVICVDAAIANRAAKRFDLDLRPVEWHPTSPGAAMQIVVPTLGDSWFDHDELRAKAVELHGVPGATCVECGVWRWMPLTFDFLPQLGITPALGDDVNIAASPEWFGDGWRAFRQIVVRRELAEMIAATSPRDFKVQPVS